MTLHLELKESLESEYRHHLAGDVRLTQDALLAEFDNGLALEVRYLNPEEYSLGWSWGDAELRIDTAPLHAGLGTFPNHLHDMDGQVGEDRLTRPGAAPWANLKALLDAVLEDPLLNRR